MQNTQLQPNDELRQFIETTVKSHYAQYGYEDTSTGSITSRSVIISIMKDPEIGAQFQEFWTSLESKISTKLVENGYTQCEPMEAEYGVMLQYIKLPESAYTRDNPILMESIETIIADLYSQYDEKSTAKVYVDNKKLVQIHFDSERPYLGMRFWELLQKASTQITEKLKSEGYVYQKSRWLYDFLIWDYVYEENESSKNE